VQGTSGRKGDEGTSTSNKNTAVLDDITIMQECEGLMDMQNCTFLTLNFVGIRPLNLFGFTHFAADLLHVVIYT
jgi:hypothetical protein